jgi:protein ImuB
MFACLYSLSVPVAALIKIAQDFTPRFEVVGPLVMLEVGGLSRLFGSPRDIGEQLRRTAAGPVRIALAPTQTAAALLALGQPGLMVIEPDGQRAALAPLTVSVLGEFERVRLTSAGPSAPPRSPGVVETRTPIAPHAHSEPPLAPPPSAPGAPVTSGGWMHPRDSHAAARTRQPRRALFPGREHGAPVSSRTIARDFRRDRAQQLAVEALLETLRRWGIRTFGELAVLPPGDVYERLGARGVLWQRLARGEDSTPLVPWVPEDPFESALALEWPIEGLEPLSFVLGRLFDPLAERLERADRGAAILHTHLHLVNRTVHARTLQLPSPLRDAKTLRTLVLLDLETNPPAAAIDQVRVLVEPTPGRVTQWALFERAQPSPEQVSTLLARLKALMGDSHVGSPQLVDSWKPGAFEMTPFAPAAPAAPVAPAAPSAPSAPGAPGAPGAATALRRFRLPVPARVHVHEGRPTRIVTDRRGVTGGAVAQAAGPWRTSGEWWNDAQPGRSWDRDEWDVALTDGTLYRIYVERDIGQWFLEGVVD